MYININSNYTCIYVCIKFYFSYRWNVIGGILLCKRHRIK